MERVLLLVWGMAIALFFWIIALGTCGYAACFGGREGRWFAFIYILQCLLTVGAAYLDVDWSKTNWPTFAVDLLLLVAFFVLATRTTHFWPLWVFGFHLITVSAHLASMLAQSVPIQAYFIIATMWSLPKLGVVVLGIHLDREARRREGLNRENARRLGVGTDRAAAAHRR